MPESLVRMGLRIPTAVFGHLGVVVKKKKADMGRQVAFLGIRGAFPSPETDMILLLDLTDSGGGKWQSRTDEYIAPGPTHRNELGSLTGRISYPKASSVGRRGREMTLLLPRGVYSDFYDPEISGGALLNSQWRAYIVRRAMPRTIPPRRKTHRKATYTDATSETIIMADNAFGVADFKNP